MPYHAHTSMLPWSFENEPACAAKARRAKVHP